MSCVDVDVDGHVTVERVIVVFSGRTRFLLTLWHGRLSYSGFGDVQENTN